MDAQSDGIDSVLFAQLFEVQGACEFEESSGTILSQVKGSLRPRPHVSGYFRIRNFFFPDTATVHTHPANSTANPEKNKSEQSKFPATISLYGACSEDVLVQRSAEEPWVLE